MDREDEPRAQPSTIRARRHGVYARTLEMLSGSTPKPLARWQATCVDERTRNFLVQLSPAQRRDLVAEFETLEGEAKLDLGVEQDAVLEGSGSRRSELIEAGVYRSRTPAVGVWGTELAKALQVAVHERIEASLVEIRE
jgi:hypothetical protein